MKICPTCGQSIIAGHRICSRCGNPIRQRDKWRIGPDGRLQHKDCGDPEMRKESKSGQMRME